MAGLCSFLMENGIQQKVLFNVEWIWCTVHVKHINDILRTTRGQWVHNWTSPVSIIPGLDWNQDGKTSPLKIEKPRMRRLREEFRSTYWREKKEESKRFSLFICFIHPAYWFYIYRGKCHLIFMLFGPRGRRIKGEGSKIVLSGCFNDSVLCHFSFYTSVID